jgi:hypothetical protein
METRNVKISLETAQRWHNGTDNELKELAVQTYPELSKKELPKSWEELCQFEGCYVFSDTVVTSVDDAGYCIPLAKNKNVFATKEQAEASIALAQLSQLREVYRNNWVPDWTDFNEKKFCIAFIENKIFKENYISHQYFLSFQDSKTRDLFLENFKDLIETAKPLLS